MKNTQSGNVLIFILIAIFLLGGLTVLMSRTSNQSDDTGDSEQVSLKASELLRNAAGVGTAVARLLSSGCSENELSFNDPGITSGQNYINPAAPVDHSCDIYNAAGGGMTYKPVPDSWLTTVSGYTKTWHVNAGYCVNGVGTGGVTTCTKAQTELRLFVDGLTLPLCNEVNHQLGVASVAGVPPADDDGTEAFAGTFTVPGSWSVATIADSGSPAAAPLIGKKAGCLKDTAGSSAGRYVFYYTLITR